MAGGINNYSYAAANPICFIDPQGLLLREWWNYSSAGMQVIAHLYMEAGIEGAGTITTSAEIVQSVYQLGQNGWKSDNAGFEEYFYGVMYFGGFLVAEGLESGSWAIEMLLRTQEDALIDEGMCMNDSDRLSNKLKEFRIGSSNASLEFRDLFNDFISGGNREDTFITGTRRALSDLGTINRTILAEKVGEAYAAHRLLKKELLRSLNRWARGPYAPE